jgi:hypothetical protein
VDDAFALKLPHVTFSTVLAATGLKNDLPAATEVMPRMSVIVAKQYRRAHAYRSEIYCCGTTKFDV